MRGTNTDVTAQAEALIETVFAFHGQSIYAGLEAGIARKKRLFRIVFPMVRRLSRSRLANMFMLVSVLLVYRAFRCPDPGPKVFQYGMTSNNVASFRRLDSCLPEALRAEISLNGRAVRLTERIAVVMSLDPIWRASCVLSRRRHARALPHIQAVIALAAQLFYLRQPLPDSVQILCVSSDHSPMCQGLLSVAAQARIKTCYIQHAPVTKFFPPLAFDLSVLYDRSSSRAYSAAAERLDVRIDTNVVYLPPFANEFKKVNAGTPPYSIGICLSFLPELEALDDLTQQLLKHPSVLEVVFRRHPRCTIDLSCVTRHSAVSVQRKGGTLNAFLDQVDTVLVPSSGVAIEALHRGRPTFYTPGVDDLPTDYYNFVADGILPEFGPIFLADKASLLRFFSSSWEDRFADYDETVHRTISEAQSTVAANFVRLL